jgi:hypothetical protein
VRQVTELFTGANHAMTWASCEFNGFDLGYLPVLNAAAFRGKTWLIEIGGCMPVWVVVEAETVPNAIEVLSDDPEFGDAVHVREEDLAAYPEEERQYDRMGRAIDPARVKVHGRERADLPYPVRYHDEGFPAQGIDPRKYASARLN